VSIYNNGNSQLRNSIDRIRYVYRYKAPEIPYFWERLPTWGFADFHYGVATARQIQEKREPCLIFLIQFRLLLGLLSAQNLPHHLAAELARRQATGDFPRTGLRSGTWQSQIPRDEKTMELVENEMKENLA
jgi:hypothetical protein